MGVHMHPKQSHRNKNQTQHNETAPLPSTAEGKPLQIPRFNKKNCYQVKKERRKLSLLSYIFEVFEKNTN